MSRHSFDQDGEGSFTIRLEGSKVSVFFLPHNKHEAPSLWAGDKYAQYTKESCGEGGLCRDMYGQNQTGGVAIDGATRVKKGTVRWIAVSLCSPHWVE